MTPTTGTVYRCKVELGEDPSPCADEIQYLRWDGKIWRDVNGEVWLGVHSAKVAPLDELPPEWKEILASELISDRVIVSCDSLTALRKMFPRRRR
jgi:hypothetical protein